MSPRAGPGVAVSPPGETEAQGFVLPPYSVCIGLFFNFFQLLCVRAALPFAVVPAVTANP